MSEQERVVNLCCGHVACQRAAQEAIDAAVKAAVAAKVEELFPTCGGCKGIGAHRRHCPRNPDYHPWTRLADQVESVGDSLGEPGLANRAWDLAGRIRAGKGDHPWRGLRPSSQ